MNIKVSPKILCLWSILQIAGAISVIKIFSTPVPPEYELIFLLPLSYCILNIVFIKSFTNGALSIFPLQLIHGFIFIRAVIAPLFWVISGFSSAFTSASNNYINEAVLIMIYELFLIYLIVTVNISKLRKYETVQLSITGSLYARCKFLIIAFVIALLGLLLIAPNAVMLYRSGLEYFNYEFTGFDSRNVISQYAGSNIARFGMTTFRYVFNVGRIVIPCIVIIMMKYRNRSKKSILLVTLVFIFILDFIIMDDTLAYSVCFSLIVLIFMSKVLNDSRIINRSLLIAFLIVMTFFTSRLLLSIVNEHLTSNTIYISRVLQSYFSGVTNIAAGLNMPDATVGERAKFFIYEILRGIPYATTIFGLDSTSMGIYFNSTNGSVGQIIPTISSCCYYLGVLFAPLFSCILTSIGVRAGMKGRSSTNPLYVVAYLTIALYSILGISMYSLEIICVGFFCVALPIYILGWLIKE